MNQNLKIFTDNIEQEALNQINELLEQESFKNSKVRIMPDVHAGKGCVIGFTGDLGDKVIPNIVGVDIGCGMLCVGLGNVDIDLEKLDKTIKKYIPSGFNVHNYIKDIFYELKDLYCYGELRNKEHIEKSLGTLGGGNHFIEVDVDDENNKYLVIHTGSRNLGKQVAEIYQAKAIDYCSYKEEMKKEKERVIKEYKEQGKQEEIQEALVKINKMYGGKTKLAKDLCYLEGELREQYLHDMEICQMFARENRRIITREILMKTGLISHIFSFETVHNYISFEDNIVRKGAISARKGEKVLIPMNMRDGCIIAIGKGNEDWNNSAPHGAGRIMSRVKAREKLNLENYKKEMGNIYTTSVNMNTIDEAPEAYKPMQEIIDNIGDTVDIIKIIKPIYNFKASD